MDRHRSWRSLDLDALTSEFVEPLAVDADRRHHRRDLLDVTDEVLGHGAAGVVERHARHVVRRQHVSRVVERRGRGAQDDLAGVALAGLLDEAEQPCRLADRDDEDAGGIGVERARVTDLALTESTPEHADHVVARDTGRLVHHGDPVRGRRLAPRHQASRSSGWPGSSVDAADSRSRRA